MNGLPEVVVRFDMRAPSFGAGVTELYRAAIDMARYADERGADVVMLTEHHGAEDGYLPAPFVLAGAMAAVTSRVRIRIGAVVLPLHDPVAVAEQAVVLDQISAGRAEIVVALGYVRSEFAMYGLPFDARARLMDDKLPRLRAAMRGDAVVIGPVAARVTPPAVQAPGPRLYVAGGVTASARRAARHADGFYPLRSDPALIEQYAAECAAARGDVGRIIDTTGPMIVHVGDDTAAAWDRCGPHLLHEMNAYGAWAAGDPAVDSPYRATATLDDVRNSRMYGVLDTDACLRVVASGARRGRSLVLHPLVAGLDPAFARDTLHRFFDDVLPRARELAADTGADPITASR